MRRALLLAVLAALVLPATAFAHASLRKETPSFKQRLAVAPRQIVLQFDQTVDALPKAIEVLTQDGKNVAGTPRVVTAQREIVAPLPRLPKGAYTVRWQALSNDGHIVSGVYTFGVRVNGAAGDGRGRRARPDAHRGHRALAVLPRTRARGRRDRLPAADRAWPAPAARAARASSG